MATVKVGYYPTGVAVDAAAVWVTNFGSSGSGNGSGTGTVSRIDPASNQVMEIFKGDYNPTGVAADADTAWVADPVSHTLSRVDRVVR